ncbi:putative exonuclease from phage origin [Pseudogulbenkiania sp. NH8B]|uniref:3'-5' exonuclease n=1 Tax=Pseudogulbenkiania sp. (strain NH8B) TaxID=748280 RepID=UPI0002279A76|nr:3'-5' exonuclease [Pseudogulbenkiania sp. NH8B]BAK75784.1 putative exonuclease from phage origin [Pseudogulbenkiania sp. NH8B]
MTPLDFVSLDVETLDQASPSAAIATIGAVVVIGGQLIDKTLYIRVDLDDASKYGTVSADTLLWHIKQGMESLKELANPDRLPLVEALTTLSSWLHNIEAWHGSILPIVTRDPDFDLSIVADKYRKLGQPIPWKYCNGRSHRSRSEDLEWILQQLGEERETSYITSHPVSHHALADATEQAKYLCNLLADIQIRIEAMKTRTAEATTP